jgi:hypothetical protein
MNGKGDTNRTMDRVAYSNHFQSLMDTKCSGCEFYVTEQCRCSKSTDGCLRKEGTNEESKRTRDSKAL